MIYLDHAAATPVDEIVLAEMLPYFSTKFYNPSATYSAAKNARQRLETARRDVAAVLGSRPNEITFTAGGSEANNLAIKGVMDRYPDKQILVSNIEHDSVIAPSQKYSNQQIEVDDKGQIKLDKLRNMLSDEVVMVSVMMANNEVGSIQPIRQVARLISEIKLERKARGNDLPLYLHTDACQAANYLDLHISRLGVDMMTLNGGKIYGPKQSGVLYVNSRISLVSQIDGGGQERGRRSGTENLAFAVGFAKSLVEAQARRHEMQSSHARLQKLAFAKIAELLPTAVINGSTKYRLANNIHLTIPGQDNERLLFALDEEGIMAAAGSACSASSEEPSHVLRALGISEQDAQSSLRLTFGRSTTEQDIVAAIESLADIVK